MSRVDKSEETWKQELTPEQFRILREAGTERPFSGPLLQEKREGRYLCAGCGERLFESDSKYDSGSGWPSFTRPADDDKVEERRDLSHGMERVEVRCASCGGHLGHVFPDGPGPEGLRYCINSAALDFASEDADPGGPAA